jgi:hypothetical protein
MGMEMTQVATNIGDKDNACGVCALLSVDGRQEVKRLLEQLDERLGDTIWCMPTGSLHMTLCEIMQAKPYAEDKEALFNRNLDGYRTALDKAFSGIPPIKVVFDQIEVSPQAIIIRGSDDGTFNALRAQLVDSLPLPTETKRPPDIIHSSIARFTKAVDLSIVEAAVAELNMSFTELVTEFQLMHNGWPHMLNYELATRYPLLE